MLTISSTATNATQYALCCPYEDCPPPPNRVPDYHPSYQKAHLPLPPMVERGSLDWNVLDWPVWGLTRVAKMSVLLPGDDWALLSATLNDDRAVTVRYDDEAGGTGSVSMYVIDAVPVSDTRTTPTASVTGSSEVLWALSLADARYLWNDNVYNPSSTSLNAPTAWGDLLHDLILAGTGADIPAADIDAALTAAGTSQYPQPQPLFSPLRLRGYPACLLADAVAAALNCRLLCSPDGSIYFQTWLDAQTDATIAVSDLHAGGFRRKPPAGAITVVQYGISGVQSISDVTTGSAATRKLTAWLPHDATGRSRWVADYLAWTDQTLNLPDAVFAGLIPLPLTSYADRWVLDHDAMTTHIGTETSDYPWPLVGQAPQPSARDELVDLCVVKSGGYVTDIRASWLTPDDSINCEIVDLCPACE